MKLLVSAFALLIAGTVASYAQGTGTPKAPTTAAQPGSSSQCWDMATNAVKNSQGSTLSQGANTSAQAPGGVNPSTPPSSSASGMSKSTTTGMAPAARPAGMPTC